MSLDDAYQAAGAVESALTVAVWALSFCAVGLVCLGLIGLRWWVKALSGEAAWGGSTTEARREAEGL